MQRPSMLAATFVLALSFVGCAEAESGSIPADTGADYGEGPTTTRPDDGVDTTSPVDSGAADSGAADSTTTDATSSDTSASDTATSDTASTDGGSPGAARIHEVFVDVGIAGDNTEWIEIAAPAGTAIDALWLRVLDKTGAVKFNKPVANAGAKMKSSGFWVVGGALATSTDKFYTLTDGWGLPSEGGSIQLTRNDGVAIELVDVVGYGTAPTSTTASEPKKLVEGTAAALPASGSTNKTIGRKSVPGDSDDNASDFCVMTATPGAANGSCP